MGSQGSNPEAQNANGQQLVPVEFIWNEPCSQVYFCGSFNQWRERIPMTQIKAGLWKASRELAPGKHQFKFIVDSQWRCSANYATQKDSNGNVNNYIVVENQNNNNNIEEQKQQMQEIELLFNTEIPENPCQMWNGYPQELPRQLVKTPLNASIISKEFTPSILLPLPDHVVLTHFFRQRKRRNYSVSASTSRYRGKYITVVLYVTTDFEGHEEIPELVDIYQNSLIQ